MNDAEYARCLKLCDAIAGSVAEMLEGSKAAVEVRTLAELATELRVRILTIEGQLTSGILKTTALEAANTTVELRKALCSNRVAELTRALGYVKQVRAKLDDLS